MALSDKKFQKLEIGDANIITAGLCDHYDPAWSPDGRWLAFSGGAGEVHIFITNPQGLLARQLTHGQGIHAEATWAPDGRTLAYTWKKTGAGRWQIWIGDLHEPHATRCLLSSTRFHYQHPSFSPNGRQMVFSSSQGASPDAYNLWVMDLETNQKSPLTHDATRHDSNPTYSPDGTKILYCSEPAGQPDARQLHWLDLETGAISRLTGHERAAGPGTFIAKDLVLYTRHSNKRGTDLRALNLSSGETLRLVPGASCVSICNQEDGSVTLAWANGKPTEIHTAQLDGYQSSASEYKAIEGPLTIKTNG